MIKLYSYCRSSTSYRARIALHLKSIEFETVPVNLLKGEQRSDAYLAVNPLGGVPALSHDGFTVSQSLAIIDYLDHLSPERPLWPHDPKERAFALQIALAVAEDIHPLINLKTQKYLADHLGASDADKKAWYKHWTMSGMAAIEKMLASSGHAGDFALGQRVSIADLCLIPNMYSMRRFNMDLSAFPHCLQIERHCIQLEAFQKAAPETQPDAAEDLEQIHGPHAPLLQQ